MMGASPYVKRNDLIRMKRTASEQEFSRWTKEVLFANGHAVEAAARPIIEAEIGEELFPAIGISDEHPQLSASFDGITMDERTVFECKQWNEAKAAHVRAGTVPAEDYWQCVHALVVSRAERLIYTVSDGTPERTVSCELRLQPEDEKALLAGWRQFDLDVAAYQPEPVAAAVVGTAPEALPALLLRVTGAVTQSNLPEFKGRALEVFRGINTNLQTDEDFASAELAVKFCKGVEERIESAKAQALAETASIDALFRALDEISGTARSKRLELDRLVKGRKEAIRYEIIRGAEGALAAHLSVLNERLRSRGARVSMPTCQANFAGAIKGLKTVASIKNAVDTELASIKIEANNVAEKIDGNLRILAEQSAGHETLFPDTQALVMKDSADLTATIKARIADHQQAEQRRRAEEAARTAPVPPTAPVAAPAATAQVKPRMRSDGPTAEQVVALVATTYGVSQAAALGWLARMNFHKKTTEAAA